MRLNDIIYTISFPKASPKETHKRHSIPLQLTQQHISHLISTKNLFPPTQSKKMAAEQDRYEGKFGLKASTIQSAKNSASNFASQLPKGSGAEQDRYSTHFNHPAGTFLGSDGKAKLQKLAGTKGIGAEQDRYDSHFGLDAGQVKSIKEAMFQSVSGAEQDRYAGWFGLGADGRARLARWKEMRGVGAEQDRYGRAFEGIGKEAGGKVREGIEEVKRRF
jgi:hypothetical protein